MSASISLRRYLSLHLGLVIALQSVILALLAWHVLLPRMRTDLGFRHQALAQAIAGQVAVYLIGGERQLRALADYAEIQGRRPAAYWSEVLDTQCGNGDLFETIYFTDFQKETITSVGLARHSRSRREDLMGLDLSGRDFLGRARELNRPVWSRTFLSTASSRWAVAVTVPLAPRAIIGEITVDQLHRFISDLPLSAGLFTMILDRRGRVVADSQRQYGGQQLNIHELPSVDNSGERPFSSSEFNLDGRQMIGSVVAVDHLGWTVLVAQTHQSAFQSIRSIFFLIIIGLSMALAVGVMCVWFQSGKLTRLFRLYEQKAHSIAQGQYDLPWPPAKTTEFEELADSLQQMAMKISQRESQLVASESHLSITLDAIGDAVITTDVQSTITRMNPSAERLTAWPCDAAVGRPLAEVFQIINGQTRRTVADPVQQVIARGEIVGLANNTVLIDKNGHEYQIADSAAPIRHSGGGTVGVVLVFRDITEIYAQEQAIRESEGRLNQAISVSKIGVFDHDLRSDAIYWSPQQREIYGLAPDEPVTLKDFLNFIHPEDAHRVGAAVHRAFDPEGDGLWENEFRIVCKDGSIRWVKARSQTFFEGKGEAAHRVRTVGAAQDITERKQWERALQASERRFKELFENAPVMYLITRLREEEPHIIETNHLFLETLGYRREEVVDTPLTRYYTEASRKELSNRSLYHLIQQGKVASAERSLLTKDGRTVYTLMHARPEVDALGKVTGLHFMYLNISRRKRAEQEAKRLEAALQQAQKMEAIGTLAGGIAHDFNNILSAVIGYAELALFETAEGTSIRRNVEQIFTAGMRAKDLVQQILAFSRQNERELKPLQIAPLIKEALKLLRSSLPSTIEIKQLISTDVDNVMADPTQIHQIVMNLCTNAAQAMEENGGCLTVALSELSLSEEDFCFQPGRRAGDYLKLMVQDSGHGIPEHSLKNIFNPYFTTKEKGKGTGLGLSVVHGIVQNYGGAIDVESEPGVGSTFSVYIPAIKNRQYMENRPEVSLPSGSEHILLVDDEPILVEVGQMMLERLGYRVTICHSGPEALEVMNSCAKDIDLVISDMTMPKMTGDKLAAALLEIDPDLPIILCTGFSQKISDDRVDEMGVKALAMKPMAQNELAFLVRSVLDEAKTGSKAQGIDTT